ncbi:MAG: MBL fold metallo-hydrolase [Ignavibacteria bacterium]|nr:MBL fold metallo-hydrolase [Ignavibacteria bacterium]
MRIKFLGTGSGLTSLKRFHSSLLVTSHNFNLLVDCGDGISRAILNQSIGCNVIDSILISHLHPDHYSGLPSLITQMKLCGRTKELSVFVHSSNKNFIDEFIFHSYLFKERLNFKLNIIPFDEEKEIKLISDFTFISKLNSHLEKYRRASLETSPLQENRLDFASLSFYFKDDENSAIYSGDVGSEIDLFLFNQKVDWFITEITHIKVENLEEVFEILNPGKMILTHIGDDFEEILKVYLESLQKPLKSLIFLAFDELELNQSM